MGKKIVYMDNAATTPLREEVLHCMLPYLKECYGNPSSIYQLGREAREAVEEARRQIARAIGAQPEEIYFTSGGTEANNLSIRGLVNRADDKVHVITSSIEHHAVLDVCEELEREGHEVTCLPVDRYGMVNAEDVKKALTPKTILITVMTANNEVGTMQPIEEIGRIAQENQIAFHTDAVQAVGSVPVDVTKMKVDLLSLSGHKFNGPKGTGALYVREGIRLHPLWRGGAQEKKLRPGTENVAGIVGLGKALELATREMVGKKEEITSLRNRLMEGLLSLHDVILNGHPTIRLPGNLNVSVKHVEGESLLLSLDMEGVAVSSGSACTSGSLEPSHVLTSMGLEQEAAHGSLRLSLGRDNTVEDVDKVLQVMPGVIERLRRMSSVYQG